MEEYKLTSQFKGDILLYKADGGLGKLISLFTRSPYSHISLALGKDEHGVWKEIDAAVENNGVTENEIDLTRTFHFIPLPFDEAAYQKAKAKFIGVPYGKKQVVSKGVVILTGWDWLLYVEGVDCSEFVAEYLKNHWLYAKVVGIGKISKRLQRKMNNPSSLTPKLAGRVAVEMAKYNGSTRPIIIKHFRLV